MRNEKSDFCQHLLLLKKIYPQFGRVVDSAIEDVEDLEQLSEGTVYKRIFKAVSEGYQTAAEIARRTGIDKDALKKYLDQMVASGTMRVEEQGGKTEGARGARKILYVKATIVTIAKA